MALFGHHFQLFKLHCLTNSDFPTDQTLHQNHYLYTDLDLHRIMSGFHRAFATGVASQQGTLTLPDKWFRPPFWDLLVLQLLRPDSSNLPCLYSTFHLEYLLVLTRFCFVWLRITDEGSVPDMRIWSIFVIKSDFKWYIHLGRSLFYISTTWCVLQLVDQRVPEGTCSQDLRSTLVDS